MGYNLSDKFLRLRQQAEQLMSQEKGVTHSHIPGEIGELFHELETYQIELELQNHELQQSQQALSLSQKKYSDLYDFAPLGYLTISDKGLIVNANLTASELLGVERSNLIKVSLSNFIVASEQDKYHLYKQGILESREAKTCSLQMKKYDGSLFFAQLNASFNSEIDGNGDQFQVIMSDITESRKTTEKLLSSEFQYHQLAKHINAGLVIHALDTSILFFNDMACELLGLTSEQMLRKEVHDSAWQFVHEDGRSMSVADYPVSIVLSTKKPLHNYLVGIITADKKQTTWVLCNAFNSINYEGNEQVIVTFIDITQRKIAEKELKESEEKFRAMFNQAIYR